MKPQLIVALDTDSFTKAKKLVDRLYPAVKIFKVGSQLFTACGPKAIEYINKKGADVFLDLKFYDIPNTVASAVCQAVRLGVKMLTLHIIGGGEMLKAAVKAAKNEVRFTGSKRPLLLGITVLTSQKASPSDVLRLAKIGIHNRLDGVVCSVREARFLRKKIKKNFVVVTPGIRPACICRDDQKRTATVEEAVQSGSNFLVIGRPVLEAKNPLGVVQDMIKYISPRNVRTRR